MRYTLLMTIALLGIATADAQTVTEPNSPTSTGQNLGTGVGSDPLSVPTSTVPSGSPRAASGPASGADATGSAGASTAGASASPSSNPQVPLVLPGEMPNTSSQAAITTGTAPSHASPICPPPVPSTDGGSAHLSGLAGASLDGC